MPSFDTDLEPNLVELRNAVDQLKDRLKSAIIVLASVEGPTKVVLVAGVTMKGL